MIQWLIRKFNQHFYWVPLFGGTFAASKKNHGEAFKELALSLTLATSPLWGGTFIFFILHNKTQESFLKCFFEIISRGELFIYAASTIAPVFYIIIKDRNPPRNFPSKTTFVIIAVICCLLSTIIFTLQRIQIDIPFSMIKISMWLYVIAIVVIYFARVYNNTDLPEPSSIMRENDQDYIRRFRDHRL